MTTKSTFIAHVEGSKATLLAKHIDQAQPSADEMCRGGWNPSAAVAIARMIKAGVPCVEQLRQLGHSSSDAVAISAAIVTRGAH